MFTQATFKVSDPQDTQFKGIPEALEPLYKLHIPQLLQLVNKYQSPIVGVDFHDEPVRRMRSCGAAEVVGTRRVCVITLSGLMTTWAVRSALTKMLFKESKAAVDIRVSWRLQKPMAIQCAA